MTAAMRLWIRQLPIWINARPDRERHSEDKMVTPDLALRLTLAEDINEALQRACDSLQPQISTQLDATLILIGPESQGARLVHAPQSAFERPRLLRFQLNQPASQRDDHLRFSLPGSDCGFYACQLNFDDIEKPAWLVISFAKQIPPQPLIDNLISPIAAALTQGLRGWQQQQQRIQAAVCKERSAIAAELHDSTAQVLGYMRLRSARLVDLCNKQTDPELQAVSSDLMYQTRSAYRHTRELIACARLTIEQGQLVAELQRAIEEFEQRSAIVFELDNRLSQPVCSVDDTQVLFIIREALCNIVRHSHASHARIRIQHQAGQGLQIRIEDNGKGICSDQARSDSFGLKIMRERAHKIRASFSILPRPNGGTRIELQLAEEA